MPERARRLPASLPRSRGRGGGPRADAVGTQRRAAASGQGLCPVCSALHSRAAGRGGGTSPSLSRAGGLARPTPALPGGRAAGAVLDTVGSAREGGAGASFTLRVISSVPASRWTACVAGPVAGRPLRLTTLLVTSRGCAGWRAAAPRERLPARPVTPSPTRGPFSSMCTEYSQESHVTCERHSFQQTRKRSVLP